MDENLIDIPSFVKKVREKLDMKQPKFAEFMGCTKGNVSAWEKGRHQPSYLQLLKMSEISGVPLPHEKEMSLKETQQKIIESINTINTQEELNYLRGTLELALGILSGKKITENKEDPIENTLQQKPEEKKTFFEDRRKANNGPPPGTNERRKEKRRKGDGWNPEGIRFWKTH